jgi:uncharacterized protein YcaQ
MSPEHLSIDDARRLALAAQGLDRPRPARRVSLDDVRRVIHRVGLLQLDFVNVLVPSHYQVLFSRLGPYDRARLDALVYRRREFTEQWAHEASVVPVATWPLLRHRMATHRVRPWGFERFMKKHQTYVASVLDEVRRRGPLSAEDLPVPDGTRRRLAHSWYGTVPRAVLEAHFGRGLLAVADRRGDFARRYDFAERIIPPHHHRRQVGRAEAERVLLLTAARAHGVGTAADLADYFRMPVRDARPRLQELLAAGDLREARVEGWREPAYLIPGARLPRRLDAAALLSPFDPVVWFRPRAVRLFDFDYRFEIFVPPERRRWGCYVLPFLLGDRLAARVDLKADRRSRRLRVPGAFLEAHADPDTVAVPLAKELRTLAVWLDLDEVQVGRRGGLVRALHSALRR